MMNKQLYYNLTALIFIIIGILHLLRLIYGWQAVIGEVEIPLWVSWFGVAIASYLGVRGFQFAGKR